MYDTAGKRYLDLIAGIGVNALGYAHPQLTKVIREQAGLLLHISNLYYHEYQGPLAERIVQNQRSGSRVLLQLRRRSHGRRVENGPGARE